MFAAQSSDGRFPSVAFSENTTDEDLLSIDVTAEGMIECSIQLLNVNKIQGKQNIFSTDKETMVDFKSSHK